MDKKIAKGIIDHLNNFYQENPYTNLLGIRVERVDFGQVNLAMTIEKKHTNFYGIAHGGAIMSLGDTAMGATCLSCNKKVVTQAMNTTFIKAAPVGMELLAIGRVIHNGRRTMACEVEIIDAQGVLYGKGSATFFVLGELAPEE